MTRRPPSCAPNTVPSFAMASPFVRPVHLRNTVVSPFDGSYRRMRSSAMALRSIVLPSQARPPVLPLYGPATRSKFQLILFSTLSRRHAGDVDARTDHRADVGDVKRLPVVVAEREIGRVVSFGLDAHDDLAGRVMNPY